jgi:hypothetical protein
MIYLATAQHTSWPATASGFTSGSHLPVEVAVPIIAVVVPVPDSDLTAEDRRMAEQNRQTLSP